MGTINRSNEINARTPHRTHRWALAPILICSFFLGFGQASAESGRSVRDASKATTPDVRLRQGLLEVTIEKAEDLYIQKFEVGTVKNQWHFSWVVRNVGTDHSVPTKLKITCVQDLGSFGYGPCPSGLSGTHNINHLWPAKNPQGILNNPNGERSDVASAQVVSVVLTIPADKNTFEFTATVDPSNSSKELNESNNVLKSVFDPNKPVRAR